MASGCVREAGWCGQNMAQPHRYDLRRDPSEVMVGYSPIRLSGVYTDANFYLSTIRGQRHRHCVTGVECLSMYDECQLVLVNNHVVDSWPHELIRHWLQELDAANHETVLTLRARYGSDERIDTYIELVFIPLNLDGRGIGSGVQDGYEVVVRLIQRTTTVVNVTNVSFQGPALQIRIRHGALYGHFLRATSDRSCLTMTQNASGCDHVFTCYKFLGADETRCDGQDKEVFLCVLQLYDKGQYVVPSPTTCRLTTMENSGLDTNIETLREADPRFFTMVMSGEGEGTYFLKPLMYNNYFVYFDAVDGLKLKKCDPPPFNVRSLADTRNYTFEFMPVPEGDLRR